MVPSVDLELTSDALFEAGCDDATSGIHCGIPPISISRGEAESFRGGRRLGDRGCLSVGSAGIVVVRVEPDDLVTIAEIARRAGSDP